MPFTPEQFFDVFARYNAAIWPLQWVAYAVGLAILAAVVLWRRRAGAVAGLGLAAMWAVNAMGYHWMFFSGINPAARLFAAGFAAEALLVATLALTGRIGTPTISRDAASVAGVALVTYALIIYPLIGRAVGHIYPAVPVFGVAPCPTVIFTIGILLLTPGAAARAALVIPVLWSATGGSAALLLGVPQDFGLIAAGLIALAFAFGQWRGLRFAHHAKPT